MSNSPQTLTTPIHRLHQILASPSPEQSTPELINILNSLSDSLSDDPENNELHNTAFQFLSQLNTSISSSSDTALIDALSFELPTAVARVSSLSKCCTDVAETVILLLVDRSSSPRDMLSILCEVFIYSSTREITCSNSRSRVRVYAAADLLSNLKRRKKVEDILQCDNFVCFFGRHWFLPAHLVVIMLLY